MKSSLPMAIGEVAEHFGVATHVLRHWEAVGLLTPTRDGNGQRRYGATDLYRVAAILRAKEAGLNLDDVRAMLRTTEPAARSTILRRQRDDLRRRIAEIQTSLTLIETALDCRHGDIATCPHFRGLLAEHAGIAEAPRGTTGGNSGG